VSGNFLRAEIFGFTDTLSNTWSKVKQFVSKSPLAQKVVKQGLAKGKKLAKDVASKVVQMGHHRAHGGGAPPQLARGCGRGRLRSGTCIHTPRAPRASCPRTACARAHLRRTPTHRSAPCMNSTGPRVSLARPHRVCRAAAGSIAAGYLQTLRLSRELALQRRSRAMHLAVCVFDRVRDHLVCLRISKGKGGGAGLWRLLLNEQQQPNRPRPRMVGRSSGTSRRPG
jgi:hypothetical protein